MKTILRKPVVEFLQQHASYVEDQTGTYYYLPFWFKATNESDEFEILSLDHLPKELIYLIEKMRNEK